MADKCGAENCGAEVIRATGPGLTSVMLHPVPSPRGPIVGWETPAGWLAKLYQPGMVLAPGEKRYAFHVTRCAATAPVRKERAGQAARARNQRDRPRSPRDPLGGAAGVRWGGGAK